MKKVIDHDTDYDPNDLWIGKPCKTINERYRKSQVYYDINNYKKLWLKTPFMLLPFTVSVLNTKQGSNLFTVTAVFNPLTKKRKSFISMVYDIESVIEERIGGLLGEEYTFCSAIEKSEKTFFKHRMIFGLPKNKNGTNNFILYDSEKEQKTVEDIVPNTKLIAVIELFEVWIDDTKKIFHGSWNIVHGKLFQDVIINENYLMDCIEDGTKLSIKKSLGSTKEKYKVLCPNCEHKIDLTINLNVNGTGTNNQRIGYGSPFMPMPIFSSPAFNIPNAPPMDIPSAPPFERSAGNSGMAPSNRGFVPNLDDITNAMKKLKKTRKDLSKSDEKDTSLLKKIPDKKETSSVKKVGTSKNKK